MFPKYVWEGWHYLINDMRSIFKWMVNFLFHVQCFHKIFWIKCVQIFVAFWWQIHACSTENKFKLKYLKKLHQKLLLFKYYFLWNRAIKLFYLPNDKQVLLHKSVKTNKSVHTPISFWGPRRSKYNCFVLISSLKVSWPAWPCCLTFL